MKQSCSSAQPLTNFPGEYAPAMSTPPRPEAAFLLSLIGGILILLGSAVVMMWALGGMLGWGGAMESMMGGYSGMMGGIGFSGTAFFGGMSLVGLVAGIVVLVGSVLLYSRPRQTSSWGILILVFSVLSLFGMGGFFIGAILGLVGGALALDWKPITTTA